MYEHLNQNSISATEQYGFRNNSSTKKASFKLINEILLAALNDKLTVGGIFCDSVNHNMLLTKCEFCGLRGKTMHCYGHTSVTDIREY